MPRIAKLQLGPDGAMWARLDMDWDGGAVSLYTPTEIREIENNVRKEIISWIHNHDRVIVGDH